MGFSTIFIDVRGFFHDFHGFSMVFHHLCGLSWLFHLVPSSPRPLPPRAHTFLPPRSAVPASMEDAKAVGGQDAGVVITNRLILQPKSLREEVSEGPESKAEAVKWGAGRPWARKPTRRRWSCWRR